MRSAQSVIRADSERQLLTTTGRIQDSCAMILEMAKPFITVIFTPLNEKRELHNLRFRALCGGNCYTATLYLKIKGKTIVYI